MKGRFIGCPRKAGCLNLTPVCGFFEEIDLTKKGVAVALIFLGLFGGVVWSYLGYLKQKQLVAETIRAAEEQSRTDTKERVEYQLRTEENFKRHALLRADLAHCQMAAEKAKNYHMTRNQKTMPGKPGEFTVARSVVDEAEKKMVTDKAECLRLFYAHLQGGP